MTTPPVELLPIDEAALPDVGRFLSDNLNSRISPADWAAWANQPWSSGFGNHGFMLVAGGKVVGAYLAFYSRRRIGGIERSICNLGPWAVLEEHRAQGLRLQRALLRQRDLEFTDLSPSGNVVALNLRLGFRTLDTATALVPNIPRLSWPSATRILTTGTELEARLAGPDLEIYRDHVDAKAAHHLLITRGDESCYVIFRKDRRKNLPLFASILHVGNKELFRQEAHHVFRYILMRFGIPFTLAELRVVGYKPSLSKLLKSPRPKMYKSDVLSPDQVDYLYSEMTCIAW